MWKFIVKRVLLMIPIILGVTLVVFTIMYFTPCRASAAVSTPDPMFDFWCHTVTPYCRLLTRTVTIGPAIAASIAITAMAIIQRLKILLFLKSSLLS